jgi:hypothetical protein
MGTYTCPVVCGATYLLRQARRSSHLAALWAVWRARSWSLICDVKWKSGRWASAAWDDASTVDHV